MNLITRQTIGVLFSSLLLLALYACDSGGETIYFASNRDGQWDIYYSDSNGEEQINLTDSPFAEENPVLSPDRKLIAFSVSKDSKGLNVGIEVMKLKEGEKISVTTGLGTYVTPHWSPDSSRLAYAAAQPGKESYVLVSDLTQSLSPRLSDVQSDEVGDWSSDGNSVVFSSSNPLKPGIHDRNPDGVNQRQVSCGNDIGARWSPDNKKLAFISDRAGNRDIYVIEKEVTDGLCEPDADSTLGLYQLTDTEGSESDISWSPDGRQILFVSERDGNSEIYVMDSSGNNQVRLTQNDKTDKQPVWSPDGKSIAFVSDLDGDYDIFIMNSKGENQKRLTNNDASDLDPNW
jgi:Tol biopolymer transport system component